MAAEPPPPLVLIHFNDVYEISARTAEPCGGAPRFAHLLHRLHDTAASRGCPVLVFFSGDALSPSLMSTITKGRHMVPVLNALGPAAACLGNHDLDGGEETTSRIVQECAFPWLVSNARVIATGLPLGISTREFAVVQAGPWRVGVLGLIEEEWLATLSTVNASAVAYEPYIDAARRLVPILKGPEHCCNLIVALTHMRLPNDLRLAAARAVGIDLILGGHDHDYRVELGAGVPIVKSGSDFRNLSVVRVSDRPLENVPPVGDATEGARMFQGRVAPLAECTRFHVDVDHWDITSAEPEDAAMSATVHSFADVLGRKLEAVIGIARVPLDARFAAIRSQETNAGNFVADLMRHAVDADIAILNSGTLRADAVLGPGLLRMKDLVALLPMQDSIVKLRMSGTRVLEALENAVSQWPAKEGRFAQVSGLRFSFDAREPPGKRVIRSSVRVLDKAAAAAARRAHSLAAHASSSPPVQQQQQQHLLNRTIVADAHQQQQHAAVADAHDAARDASLAAAATAVPMASASTTVPTVLPALQSPPSHESLTAGPSSASVAAARAASTTAATSTAAPPPHASALPLSSSSSSSSSRNNENGTGGGDSSSDSPASALGYDSDDDEGETATASRVRVTTTSSLTHHRLVMSQTDERQETTPTAETGIIDDSNDAAMSDSEDEEHAVLHQMDQVEIATSESEIIDRPSSQSSTEAELPSRPTIHSSSDTTAAAPGGGAQPAATAAAVAAVMNRTHSHLLDSTDHISRGVHVHHTSTSYSSVYASDGLRIAPVIHAAASASVHRSTASPLTLEAIMSPAKRLLHKHWGAPEHGYATHISGHVRDGVDGDGTHIHGDGHAAAVIDVAASVSALGMAVSTSAIGATTAAATGASTAIVAGRRETPPTAQSSGADPKADAVCVTGVTGVIEPHGAPHDQSAAGGGLIRRNSDAASFAFGLPSDGKESNGVLLSSSATACDAAASPLEGSPSPPSDSGLAVASIAPSGWVAPAHRKQRTAVAATQDAVVPGAASASSSSSSIVAVSIASGAAAGVGSSLFRSVNKVEVGDGGFGADLTAAPSTPMRRAETAPSALADTALRLVSSLTGGVPQAHVVNGPSASTPTITSTTAPAAGAGSAHGDLPPDAAPPTCAAHSRRNTPTLLVDSFSSTDLVGAATCVGSSGGDGPSAAAALLLRNRIVGVDDDGGDDVARSAPLPNPIDYAVSPSGTVRRKTTGGSEATTAAVHSSGIAPSPNVTPATAGVGSDPTSGLKRGGRPRRPATWLPLVESTYYTVATKSYLSHGKDGYTAFIADDTTILIGEENGPILPTVVRNHFRILTELSRGGVDHGAAAGEGTSHHHPAASPSSPATRGGSGDAVNAHIPAAAAGVAQHRDAGPSTPVLKRVATAAATPGAHGSLLYSMAAVPPPHGSAQRNSSSSSSHAHSSQADSARSLKMQPRVKGLCRVATSSGPFRLDTDSDAALYSSMDEFEDDRAHTAAGAAPVFATRVTQHSPLPQQSANGTTTEHDESSGASALVAPSLLPSKSTVTSSGADSTTSSSKSTVSVETGAASVATSPAASSSAQSFEQRTPLSTSAAPPSGGAVGWLGEDQRNASHGHTASTSAAVTASSPMATTQLLLHPAHDGGHDSPSAMQHERFTGSRSTKAGGRHSRTAAHHRTHTFELAVAPVVDGRITAVGADPVVQSLPT